MSHSLESLFMFVEAATLGSFSAAARKLHKQQSTISEAIANLEIDLGLILFDRSTRRPTLTEHGKAMLVHAQQVLDASDRLSRSAHKLADGLESRITLVLSDTYQSPRFEAIFTEFEQRYP
ncbi:MAG: LysR family transcriptional regulator, partial [Glaciimonas sp.]|nr:LysR family transcriptional regulator [Glaciimonas sp.]